MINYNKVSDEVLYGMCMAGDGGAWTYVFNYSLKICKSKKWHMGDESEDIASEVTKNLMKTIWTKDNMREQNKFRNLIAVAAVNKIKDLLKSSRRNNIPIDDDIDLKVMGRTGNNVNQIENIERFEIVLLIDQALEKLSQGCQNVLREYFKYKVGLYDDLAETSKVLNMSISRFSTNVHRCLKKMIEFPEMKELRQYI